MPFVITLAGCSLSHEPHHKNISQFSRELTTLQGYFDIPGLAVMVTQGDEIIYENYLGYADKEDELRVDSMTVFPMASLTKIISGILLLKLVDEQRLTLADPIKNYISETALGDSVQIAHLLTHTSQGSVGKNYFYSGARFGLLTPAIEQGYQNKFEGVFKEEIIAPLKLSHTFLLKDSMQLASSGQKIAQPYFYQQLVPGVFEYGFSAAAGLTCTVRDLSRIDRALDGDLLIEGSTRELMFKPYRPGLPYGFGCFVQEFMGEKLIWGYGQYDFYSSLLLKVPERNLTLIIAANNNLMSDPPRLLYGDVTYSLFAIAFLKTFVFDMPEIPLFEDAASLLSLDERVTARNAELYRQKLLAQSIAESFLGAIEDGKAEKSRLILEKVFTKFPDYLSYADLTLLHNLSALKGDAEHQGTPGFTLFDPQLKRIAQKLLRDDDENPYALYYMAEYHQLNKMPDSAAYYFQKIVDLRNFDRQWYTLESERWLQSSTERAVIKREATKFGGNPSL